MARSPTAATERSRGVQPEGRNPGSVRSANRRKCHTTSLWAVGCWPVARKLVCLHSKAIERVGSQCFCFYQAVLFK